MSWPVYLCELWGTAWFYFLKQSLKPFRHHYVYLDFQRNSVNSREVVDMILTDKTQIIEQCFTQEADLESNVFGRKIAHPWFICRIPIPWRNMKIILSFYTFSICSRDQRGIIRARNLDLIAFLILQKKKKAIMRTIFLHNPLLQEKASQKCYEEWKKFLWTEISQDFLELECK